ncbi:MAG: hypothetical protein GC200_05910 [Tepidisphaera sp.]|nr:hypothetical protein [Tepidisphaera sp.]
MQRLWILVPILASMFIAAVLAAPARAEEPLPTDPRLVRGTLSNGFSYIIMHHDQPKGKLGMWIHFYTGSLNETDAQRGLAHYLEHMSFNGSENFPPGKVVPFFEELGMTFGRDQNAFTSFDQTTYQLTLPDTKPETLDKGMLFFADIVSRLSLLPKEIDDERAVITNEKTARKSAQQRVSELMLPKMAPGSLFAQRLPIGTEETLAKLSRPDFLDYYGKFYAASNATLIVVGDADPKEIQAHIEKVFGSAPTKPKPEAAGSGVKPYESSFGTIVTDSEVTQASVGVLRMLPMLPPETTVEQLRQEFVETIGEQAFNRRLQDKISRGGMPFERAGGSISQQGRMFRLAAANASGKFENWKEMLTALVVEVNRANIYGFTEREVRDAKRELMSRLEQAAKFDNTVPDQAHLARINNELVSGDTIMSAEQSLEMGRKLIDGITPEEVSSHFASQFDLSKVMFSAELNKPGPSDADVLQVGQDALKTKPEKDKEIERATSLMKTPPTPGKVSEQSEDAATGVWSGWLSNNARVHYKFMDERKDQVTITISLLGGELLETPENRGISQAASIAWGRAATQHLSSTDIRSLMNGRQVSVGGRAGADAMQMRVAGTPDDLEMGMQLAYLLLTEPKLEQPSFEQWQTGENQRIDGISKQPLQMFGKLLADVRYPEGDVRQRALTHEMVNAIKLEKAQAWLDMLIAHSPIEVAIVGDLPKDKAIALVEQYVGSLPSRERVSHELYPKERALALPTSPREIVLEMETATPQAAVMCGFFGPDKDNLADTRAMTLASEILSTRMIKTIREKEQLVYGIGARLEPGDAYPKFGVFSAAAPCDPKNADRLAAAIKEEYAQFGKDGPTPEEMEVAQKQIANTLDNSFKDPRYWSRMLETLTTDGLTPAEIAGAPEAFKKITAADVKAAFDKYYLPAHMMLVEVKPKPGATPAPAPAAAPATPAPAPASK